ncbi:hypothetical protein AB0X79_08175 [Pediococcus pentosaceus]|uniref:hypothetical protein n=1 Tax=Pediococcus pentosaceus TaxID=1255 RepID=UPI003F1F84E5
MNNEEIFNHCSIYENLDEFLKFNNMDKNDFDIKATEGWYMDCTCGTYNGASDIFSPWEITPENVADSLITVFHEMEWDINLVDLEGWEDDSKVDRGAILNYLADSYIFIIKDSKRIYLDMD